MNRLFFTTGSTLAGIAVIAGAYGAHAGSTLDLEHVIWIEKAARYQMYHAIALIVTALAISQWPSKAKILQTAGYFFISGILLFSGSLYIMAMTDVSLGYMTPAGGFAFIIGWIILAICGGSLQD